MSYHLPFEKEFDNIDKVFAVREWRKVASKYRERKWNREHNPIYIKKFLQTPKGKLYKARREARRRKLGFIPLNKPFVGSVAHHVDKTHTIHIPRDLHESIRHCLSTGRNMEKINAKAFDYLRDNRNA